jgi:hypothetical protein
MPWTESSTRINRINTDKHGLNEYTRVVSNIQHIGV